MRVTDDLWKSSNQLIHGILVFWYGFNYYFKFYKLYGPYWNKTENLNWTEFKTISFRTTSQTNGVQTTEILCNFGKWLQKTEGFLKLFYSNQRAEQLNFLSTTQKNGKLSAVFLARLKEPRFCEFGNLKTIADPEAYIILFCMISGLLTSEHKGKWKHL